MAETVTLTADQRDQLTRISTATLTTVLLKKGLRNNYLRGPLPLMEDQGRIVGEAFTMRFVPMREDLATPESWSSPRSTRAAIEEMPDGAVVVIDAMGVDDAGVFGDILCARMAVRGVAALVTDGVLRDGEGVVSSGLAVWCRGIAAPPSIAGLTFVGWQEPIACGGVAIFPGDVIVADGDGAVLIPKAMVAQVIEAGAEQELLEAWLLSEVKAGAKLPGLYPPNEETRMRYEAWKATQE